MARIKSLRAREILDSRAQPTIEVEALLDSDHVGRAAVPSGASTGEHEALELRDGDKKRFQGKGVLTAVRNVIDILSPALAGKDASDQNGIDEAMIRLDGTANKGRLGANAILGVSMAVSRAAAASFRLPLYQYLRNAFSVSVDDYLLPTPMLNILNGGVHADNGLDIQEFMIVPVGASSFREALRFGAETYQVLKKLLHDRKLSIAVGDEGGFAPRLKSHEEALEIISEALDKAGHGGAVRLALDAAASEFYKRDPRNSAGVFGGKSKYKAVPRNSKEGKYQVAGKLLAAADLAGVYAGWCKKYPIVSIEDPFDQDDWSAWQNFTSQQGRRIRIIGDDIFVTNVDRLERGIREGAANAILIKLNQIGTVTETVRAILRAREAGFSAVVSHRSGETEDPYIADLAVALNTGAIKTGAPCRSERLAKYNQLLRIEEELGAKARYAGDSVFRVTHSDKNSLTPLSPKGRGNSLLPLAPPGRGGR